MIPILLQLPAPTPDILVNVALGLGGIMLALERALTFYKMHMREDPAPSKTYATRDEHRKLEASVGELRGQMTDSFEKIRVQLQQDRIELDRSNEERASKLHHRIDPLAENLAKLNGHVGGMEKMLGQFMKQVREEAPRD